MDAKILIADDEAIISMDLKRTLNHFGFNKVNIVHTAEDAVNFALEKKPDLILMDINFRNSLNGIEAAHFIRHKTGIPVIFVSSSAPDFLGRDIQNERYSFIRKPVDAQELKQKIKENLNP